jgi:glycosyltransferase involved in cell wall biosynthesis
MRICYVGASAPRLFNLMRFMRDRGHDVHWIALSYPNFEITKIRIHHELNLYTKKFLKRNLLALYYLALFRHKIKKISPDILHAINIKWAGWFSVLSGVKNVVVTPQGSDVMPRQGFKNDFIHKFLRRYTLRKAELVTHGNNAMLDDIKIWASPKKTFKYFAGVNFDVMDFNINSSEFRKRLDIGGRKVVFSPRTFDPNSNIDIIIQTIPLVKKQFANILYVFVRHQEINKYTMEIKALVKNLDVKENCIFLNQVEPEDMAGYYSLADVVISILSSDGMPATLLEAMAMKKKLVLTKIPTYLQLMNEKYAFMVNVRNKEETAKEIIKSLTQVKKAAKMKETAYRWVYRNADIKKLNSGLEKIYFQMLNS